MDNLLVYASCEYLRSRIVSYLQKFFSITTKEDPTISYLSYCIIQLHSNVSLDQINHILKFTIKYFAKCKCELVDILFCTDRKVKDETANTVASSKENISKLEDLYELYSSTYSTILYIMISSHPDLMYSLA